MAKLNFRYLKFICILQFIKMLFYNLKNETMQDQVIPANTGEIKWQTSTWIVCIVFYRNVGTVWLLFDGRNFFVVPDGYSRAWRARPG